MSEFGNDLALEPMGLNKDHELEVAVRDDDASTSPAVIVLDRHNLAGLIATLEEYLGDMRRKAKQ